MAKAKLFNKQQYELAVEKAKNPKFIEKYVVPLRNDLELLNSMCPIFIIGDEQVKKYQSKKLEMKPMVKQWENIVKTYLQNPSKLRESEYQILGEEKDFPYRGFLPSDDEIRYLWHSMPLEFVVALRSLVDYHFEESVVERHTVNLSGMDAHRPFSGKSLKTKFWESNPKDLFALQEVYPEPLPSIVLFKRDNLSYLDLNPEFGNNCIIAKLLGLNYTGFSSKQIFPDLQFTDNLTEKYDRIIFHPRHCNILFDDAEILISPMEFTKKVISQCLSGWEHLNPDGIFSLELESFQIVGSAYEITSKVIEAMNLLSDAIFLGCSAFSTARNIKPKAYGVWSWQKSIVDLKANSIIVQADAIRIDALGGIRSFIPNLSLISTINIVGISGFDSCPTALAIAARKQKKSITLISLIETPFTVMARRLGACVKIFINFTESQMKSYLDVHRRNFSTTVYPFQLASQSYLFRFTLPIVPKRLWLIYATGFTYRLIRANYPNLPLCIVNVNLVNLPIMQDLHLTIYSSSYPIEEQSLEFKLLQLYSTHKQEGDMYLL